MKSLGAVAILTLAAVTSASAQNPGPCRRGVTFPQYLAQLEQDATKAGVSQRAIADASPYLVFDQGIVNRDRGQRVFGQIFTQFAGRMAADYRMQQGRQFIQRYQQAFARAEKEFGVPPAVIAAFWGLESDFGANMGNLPTLRSLVSLAYDCRRTDRFHDETIAALKIIDRGDLAPTEMIGSWAGELGQTQFLPTHYVTYAVDYDGDGRRNLLRSGPDVIGSTANYIATGLKWRRGEPWLEEIRVPQNLPWEETDLATKHTRSQWAKWGVTYPDGRQLANDDLPTSVLLPMGRLGPAFLAYPNFAAYTEWNNSLIYSTTAAYLAARIAGAAPMRKPSAPVPQLGFNDMRTLQQLLVRSGYDVGKVDGVLGLQTRIAVKTMQQKFGLPADSWPTAELLTRMRGTVPPAAPVATSIPTAPRPASTTRAPSAPKPPITTVR